MTLRIHCILLGLLSSIFLQTSGQQLESLFEKWGSEDVRVRESADAEALNILHPIVTSDIGPLIGVFRKALNDPNWYVRLQACKILSAAALNSQNNASALQNVEPFLVPLSDSEQIDLRRAALGTLALIAPRPSPPILQVFLKSLKDPDRGVRAASLIGLSRYGSASPEVKQSYLEVLKSDPDETLRGNAAQLLGGEAADEETIGALTAALSDGSEHVRQAVVASLARLGPTARSSLGELKRLLARQSGNTPMRTLLQDAIAKIEAK